MAYDRRMNAGISLASLSGAAALLLLPIFSGCGKTLASVDTEIGQTTTASVSLRPGASLFFPLSTTWVSYDDAQYILLRVELLKDARVVQTIDCIGYSFSSRGSRSGCGTGSTQSVRDCQAIVPAAGADSVRVSTRLNAGTASVKGLTVSVKER